MESPRYQVETVSPPEWKGGMNCYVIDTHEANSRLRGVHMSVASAQRIADLMNGLEANAAKARENIATAKPKGARIGIRRNGTVEVVHRVIFDNDKVWYRGAKYRVQSAPRTANYDFFFVIS